MGFVNYVLCDRTRIENESVSFGNCPEETAVFATSQTLAAEGGNSINLLLDVFSLRILGKCHRHSWRIERT